MMTILKILDYAAPYEGNFIPSLKNLEGHVKQFGGRLIYMFPASAQNLKWLNELKKEGRIVYLIDNSFFSKKVSIRNIRELNRILRKEKVHIIHTHFVAYNYTLALIKWSIIPKVRIIGNFMNEFHPPFNKYRKFKIFITRFSFDKIIGCSEAVARSLKEAGIPSHQILSVNNALDVKHLQNSGKKLLFDKGNQKVVLMFGWTFYRKGVDIALEAIKQLNSVENIYILAIALPGLSSLIENQIISQLGTIPTWIKFLSPQNDASNYYNAADVFLSASREEGLAYSVLEAAYSNCMVVVSAIGGHAQDIPHIGIYDLLNVEQLKIKLKEMCFKSDQEKFVINERQKDYVTRMYDVNDWSKKIINIYSKIL